MSFCNSSSDASTPPVAATASQTASAVPADTHTVGGVTLNGADPSGWRAALEPFMRAAMPGGVQALLGAAGMQGMPAPGNFAAAPNKPTTVAPGMATPGATIPMMQDPATKATKSGGNGVASGAAQSALGNL